MNWLDYGIVLIVGFSAIFALMRGFLREVFGLLGWVLAFLAASHWSHHVDPYLRGYLEESSIRSVVAFAALFIVTLIMTGLVGRLLALLISSVGLSTMDRMLGMVFGVARGSFAVALGFVVLLSLNITAPTLVRQSLLAPYGMQGARQLTALFPQGSPFLERVHANYQNAQFESSSFSGAPSFLDNQKLEQLMRQLDMEFK